MSRHALNGTSQRAGETLADGQARLARIAASAVGTRGRTVPKPLADRLCELTVERTLHEGYTDDVTVLAAQRPPAATPPLQAEAPAVMDERLAVRDRLSGWLEGLAVTAVGSTSCPAARIACGCTPARTR